MPQRLIAIQGDITKLEVDAIELAQQHEIKTLAFPCISTGIYRYPPEQAADIAINVTLSIVPNTTIEQIIFVVLWKVILSFINSY